MNNNQNGIAGVRRIAFVGWFLLMSQTIHAQNVIIPIPQGLVEASKLSPVVKARTEATLVPGAILLGSFLTPDALASVLRTGYYDIDSSAVDTLLKNHKTEGDCEDSWKLFE